MPMPTVPAVVIGVIATITVGYVFKQYVYEPHIAPALERLAEDYLERRARARAQRRNTRVSTSPITVEVDDIPLQSTSHTQHSTPTTPTATTTATASRRGLRSTRSGGTGVTRSGIASESGGAGRGSDTGSLSHPRLNPNRTTSSRSRLRSGSTTDSEPDPANDSHHPADPSVLEWRTAVNDYNQSRYTLRQRTNHRNKQPLSPSSLSSSSFTHVLDEPNHSLPHSPLVLPSTQLQSQPPSQPGRAQQPQLETLPEQALIFSVSTSRSPSPSPLSTPRSATPPTFVVSPLLPPSHTEGPASSPSIASIPSVSTFIPSGATHPFFYHPSSSPTPPHVAQTNPFADPEPEPPTTPFTPTPAQQPTTQPAQPFVPVLSLSQTYPISLDQEQGIELLSPPSEASEVGSEAAYEIASHASSSSSSASSGASSGASSPFVTVPELNQNREWAQVPFQVQVQQRQRQGMEAGHSTRSGYSPAPSPGQPQAQGPSPPRRQDSNDSSGFAAAASALFYSFTDGSVTEPQNAGTNISSASASVQQQQQQQVLNFSIGSPGVLSPQSTTLSEIDFLSDFAGSDHVSNVGSDFGFSTDSESSFSPRM
ncbi:hypothetical protein AMATHDRAFT_64080 [Amanita thiersii Skay4041]|uniref:Uncharacterized protein n=1 Tax=Amanita thiersii Skay4041 TaxID=703135 RepID=A0A2A9ND86_9AGAR|nr:hypothetical protein AMATHDRAFT_64080 [Amanita thiersii Skay4041]